MWGPGTIAHPCNPGTWEAERQGFSLDLGHTRMHKEFLGQAIMGSRKTPIIKK